MKGCKMKSKILIVVLLIAFFFALGSSSSDHAGFQVVCGTVRTDFVRTSEHGLKTQETESFEDRPACLMVNPSTGEAWIYTHEIRVHTDVSRVTRETMFQGFKRLDIK
jgi:hypothetical protein